MENKYIIIQWLFKTPNYDQRKEGECGSKVKYVVESGGRESEREREREREQQEKTTTKRQQTRNHSPHLEWNIHRVRI